MLAFSCWVVAAVVAPCVRGLGCNVEHPWFKSHRRQTPTRCTGSRGRHQHHQANLPQPSNAHISDAAPPQTHKGAAQHGDSIAFIFKYTYTATRIIINQLSIKCTRPRPITFPQLYNIRSNWKEGGGEFCYHRNLWLPPPPPPASCPSHTDVVN